jgi:hypothetical protein
MAIELKLIVFNVSLGLTMAQKSERNLPIETKRKKYTPLSLPLSNRHTHTHNLTSAQNRGL